MDALEVFLRAGNLRKLLEEVLDRELAPSGPLVLPSLLCCRHWLRRVQYLLEFWAHSPNELVHEGVVVAELLLLELLVPNQRVILVIF